MKNILFLVFLFSLVFNACNYQVNILPSGNTPEEVIKNNGDKISEFETYIVENTETKYDTSRMFDDYYLELKNSSFEKDISSHSKMPRNWKNCPVDNQSPVDIHSNEAKYFKVLQEPSHGNNFVGMIARSDGTYESIGQSLETTLYAGSTYAFSLFVSRSKQYVSLSRSTMKEENFNKPTILQVSGGFDCKSSNLLISTSIIEHTNWAEYILVFDVEEDVNFLLFEVFYEETGYPYDGNLLIDNISPIYKISK
jgi:hypothetical protein